MTLVRSGGAADAVALLVSHEGDDHLAPVRTALDRRGAPWRLLDTADLPQRAAVSLDVEAGRATATLALPDGPLDLGAVGTVWWRRPRGHELAPSLVAGQRAFTYNELHEAVSGLWPALDARWVNRPWSDEWAVFKGRQLVLAAELGLAVPRTRITSDPDAARRFLDEIDGAVVFKSFSATEEHWRETRLVGPEERATLDAVRHAPVIFQEYVRDALDVRVTVVGDELFAAGITKPPSSYEVDVRMDLRGARFEPLALPPELAGRLRRLLDALGLVYGAVDLKRRPDGSWVFLEVNPSGQWLWVEQRTGQPITDAVAAALDPAP